MNPLERIVDLTDEQLYVLDIARAARSYGTHRQRSFDILTSTISEFHEYTDPTDTRVHAARYFQSFSQERGPPLVVTARTFERSQEPEYAAIAWRWRDIEVEWEIDPLTYLRA